MVRFPAPGAATTGFPAFIPFDIGMRVGVGRWADPSCPDCKRRKDRDTRAVLVSLPLEMASSEHKHTTGPPTDESAPEKIVVRKLGVACGLVHFPLFPLLEHLCPVSFCSQAPDFHSCFHTHIFSASHTCGISVGQPGIDPRPWQ